MLLVVFLNDITNLPITCDDNNQTTTFTHPLGYANSIQYSHGKVISNLTESIF